MKILTTIDLDDQSIPSTNYLYRPGIKGRKIPYLFKDKRVRDFQDFLISKLEKDSDLLSLTEFSEEITLQVHFTFNFRKRFFIRDVSNCIKAVEDALVTVIGIDDGRFTEVLGRKLKNKKGDNESITFEIRVLSGDKLCECGCGNPTPLALKTRKDRNQIKGQPLRFIPQHNLNILDKKEAQNKSAESRTGRKPIESPYLPGKYIVFLEDYKRWYVCGNFQSDGGGTHARSVWKQYYGEIPEDYHVHHKNGRADRIKDDDPKNLMLLPKKWNMRTFPVLSEIFSVEEKEITKCFLELNEEIPYNPTVLIKLCEVLTEKFGRKQ